MSEGAFNAPSSRPGPPHTHAVQFYEDEVFLVEVVARFLADAHAAGHPIVVIAEPSHLIAFRARAQALGADLDRCESTVLDARETLARFMIDGLPDRERFRTEVGDVLSQRIRDSGHPVCAYGEMVDVLWKEGNAAGALALEALWNQLADELRFTLMCGYSLSAFSGERAAAGFRAVCDAHDPGAAAARTPVLDGSDPVHRELAALQATHRRATLLADAGAVLATTPDDDAGALARLVGLMRRTLGVDGWYEEIEDGARLATHGARVTVPLTTAERRYGAIILVGAPGRFDAADLATLEELGRRTALALDHARLLREARDADRRKDEFLATLGHELRNPLAPIVTALELMRLHDVAPRECAVIDRQVQYVTRLVDDLLDVSKITQGKLPLTRESVDLSRIMAKAVELTGALIDQRGHSLVVDAPRTDLIVDGDSVRLTQVVSNLLTNAAKYTPPGGRIRISAHRERNDAVVTVEDNGRGIPADMLPRIFDPFMQIEQGTDRQEGGLGLGLAVARSLVELHGGSISAASAGPDKGTRFRVRLPSLEGASSHRLTGPRPALRRAIAAKRVLVVDDNIDAADTLAEVLRDLGHDVSVAYDGPAALEVAAADCPDIAIVDIGLPVMDGHELAGRLRALAPQRALRLVALTGYGQEGDHARSRAAGFDAHLTKPVGVNKLVEAFTSHT